MVSALIRTVFSATGFSSFYEASWPVACHRGPSGYAPGVFLRPLLTHTDRFKPRPRVASARNIRARDNYQGVGPVFGYARERGFVISSDPLRMANPESFATIGDVIPSNEGWKCFLFRDASRWPPRWSSSMYPANCRDRRPFQR